VTWRFPSQLRLVVPAVAACAVLIAPAVARADVADEKALADKYAPVVRLVEQRGDCEPGEPYEPIDVELLFGDRSVALRGPWNRTDLVKIGPAANDLVDRFEYHLDFPGDALDPGCLYEEWSKRLTKGHTPTIYAHVAQEAGKPGKLALQYWFFYVFNDFNNTHEGDWEMIQLVFDAADAREALDETPVAVGYSAHEGAEGAAWGDEKLEIVDGTHPVVYPAAGSHANKFTEALYLGSSADAGVGCDDTRAPHRELRPAVTTLPSDPDAAAAAYPWITYEGRWGELQKAFFNGPTGPNLKTQWTEPITWSEDWRDRSYAVPTAGIFGTGATDLFCSGVETGSAWLAMLLANPVPMLLLIGTVLGLVVLVAVKATWTPVAPLRLARRRHWGQIISSTFRMYFSRILTFVGIGLILLPTAILITGLQWLVFATLDAVGAGTGEGAGVGALVALAIGSGLTLLALGVVQAATVCALVEIDAGRDVGPLGAYRVALRRLRPLLGAIAAFVVMWVALSSTGVLLPVAIWLAIRWCLIAPVVELEGRGGLSSLRRSGALVHGRWLRVGSLIGVGAAVVIASGPLLGALLIFTTSAPLALLNVIAGLVYVITMPLVALTTAYVYFDARVRGELEPRDARRELPAEIDLGSA
jgi:hypothetical protein